MSILLALSVKLNRMRFMNSAPITKSLTNLSDKMMVAAVIVSRI